MEKLILFKCQDQLKNIQLKWKGENNNGPVFASCSDTVHTVINSALILQTKQETKKRIAPALLLAMQVHLEFHAEQQLCETCLFH